MYAQVVIDIKHEEVNQLYDYIIPQHFEDFLARGMRVLVPFGIGNTERMGIVVNVSDHSSTATKIISSVLDSTPTLDDEMFMMLDVMSKGSMELISGLYQTVIPLERLVSYQKVVKVIHQELLPADLKHKFNQRGMWRLNVSDQIYYPRLKRLENQKICTIETIIREKKTENKIKKYQFNSHHHYTKIDKYPGLIDLHDEQKIYDKQDLYDLGLTDSMMKTLIKHAVFFEESVDVKREIEHVFQLEDKKVTLNEEQIIASHAIKHAKENQIFLLHGITGSGKTEVYLDAISHVIEQKGKVLVLVPEIQLIPYMAQRLKSRFNRVAIYHSGLSKGERSDQYKMILNDEADIILGTRSAVFLPIKQLKLIIMDEEHDDAYMQRDGVYYDCKDLVLARAAYLHIPAVLGSATPSVVSMYHAEQGDYTLLELTKRPFDLELPKITLVDMKAELKDKHYAIFSRTLLQKMEERLQKKEQTILLINRKGYAPFVMCRSCGDVPKCPHCDVSLTFYKDKKILKCPYCGYQVDFDATCQVCHEPKVKEVGVGIEYAEEQLKKHMPKARILRLDKAQTRTKNAHEIIWNDFQNEKADILIGTQMISKGLDLPKVTLVGVLLTDMLLKIPSYQSSEKAYMLLTQVTGRSGRFLQGEAVIQGYDLNHFVIKSLNSGYQAFYKEALYQRKLLGYEPFNQTSQLLCAGPGFLKTYQKAFMMRKELIALGYDVLGPSQALIKKIKDQYRFTLTIKYQKRDLKPLFECIEKHKSEEINITFLPTLDTW
jgi:primosomal protein N' (replication factor Y)